MTLTNSKITTSADDIALLIYRATWPEAQQHAEIALIAVMDWLSKNLLTLNVSKTNFIAFAPTPTSLPTGLSLTAHTNFCNLRTCTFAQIADVSKIRYLGVWIDNHHRNGLNI